MTMDTDQLIATLGRNVQPVKRHTLVRRVVIGIAGGSVVTLVIISVTLGLRPDMFTAMHGFPFWMKFIYTVSLGMGAIFAIVRLARPEPMRLRRLWLLAAPVLVLTGVGIGEMAHTPSSEWLAMWLGGSWTSCPWIVLALSMPIFLGLLWSFGRLAPTNLRIAGAVGGVAAGSWAASIYCLHCPEVSAIFVLTWYSLGIVLAGVLGALLGPRLLRW